MHHLKTNVHTFTSSVVIQVFEEYYLNCFSVKEREEGMGRGMIVWKSTVGEGREGGRLRYERDIKMGMRNEDEKEITLS
jgi:hypothetical protein